MSGWRCITTIFLHTIRHFHERHRSRTYPKSRAVLKMTHLTVRLVWKTTILFCFVADWLRGTSRIETLHMNTPIRSRCGIGRIASTKPPWCKGLMQNIIFNMHSTYFYLWTSALPDSPTKIKKHPICHENVVISFRVFVRKDFVAVPRPTRLMENRWDVPLMAMSSAITGYKNMVFCRETTIPFFKRWKKPSSTYLYSAIYREFTQLTTPYIL